MYFYAKRWLAVATALAVVAASSVAYARGPGGRGGGGGGGGNWGGSMRSGPSFQGPAQTFSGNPGVINGAPAHSFQGNSGWNQAGNWQGNRNWSGQNWNGQNWDGHGWNGYGWHGNNWWWPLVGWGPWYGGYGGYGWGYPYYYGYDYGYPAYGYYGYDSGPSGYYADYSSVPADNAAVQQTTAYGSDQGGEQFLAQARDAFRRGDYRETMRAAGHAGVDMPQNSKVHELSALALFAMKDYGGANMEAHAALAMGPPADWPTIFGYYGDANTFKTQLDALASFIQEHPKAADARFVLAYLDLAMGHKDAARDQFERVAELVPRDRIAVDRIRELGGKVPENASQAQSKEAPPAAPPGNAGETH
jgi:hypothetical protein